MLEKIQRVANNRCAWLNNEYPELNHWVKMAGNRVIIMCSNGMNEGLSASAYRLRADGTVVHQDQFREYDDWETTDWFQEIEVDGYEENMHIKQFLAERRGEEQLRTLKTMLEDTNNA